MPRMTQSEYQLYLARQGERVERIVISRHNAPVTLPSGRGEAEEALHDQIMQECTARGWIALHGSMGHRTHRTVGEPDFIILQDGGRLLLVECKRVGGKLSPPQLALKTWAAGLGHTVHVVHSFKEFLKVAYGEQ